MFTNNSTIVSPSVVISLVPTVTATSYVSGYVVGGLLTLTGAAQFLSNGYPYPGGLIQSVTATFQSGVTPALDLVVFNANPTGSTITDHAALAVVAADLSKVVGVIHMTDTTSLGSTSIVQSEQQAMPFLLASGQSTLYVAMVMRSAPTLTSTTDMTVSVQILQF